MDKKPEFELRSEEVQEILGKSPMWMIRWGNTAILVLLVIAFLITYFIKYPDIVSSQIIITTNTPPERINANTSGKIEVILVEDNSIVDANEPIAIIENAGNYIDILNLKEVLDTTAINSDSYLFPFHHFENAQFGTIESAFASFKTNYIANLLNNKLKPYEIENNSLSNEQIQIKTRILLLEQQKNINWQEYTLKEKEFERFKTLYSKGVISTQEFEEKKTQTLQFKRNYKTLLSSISSLKSTLISNKKNITNTEISQQKEYITLDNSMKQSFHMLKKAITDWELLYVLKSSMKGTVNYGNIWTNNQRVSSGQNVITIVPIKNNGYIGKMTISSFNSGKIKLNQKVNIQLSNYPYREFGILKGYVKKISLVPNEEGKLNLDIGLSDSKLITSYNKEIEFKHEMHGNGEIITDNLRLIERILFNFKEIVNR